MRTARIVFVAQYALMSLAPLAASYGAAEITLTVKAGAYDRSNTPVSALLELPKELADAATAELIAPNGQKLIGQLTAPGLSARYSASQHNADQKPGEKPTIVTRQLWFIVPQLGRGQELRLSVRVPGPKPENCYAWKDTPGQHAELSFAGRPVLRYMYKPYDPANREETYKVYHHVFEPDGKVLLTKGPGGLFTHHRGLFFGYCAISFPGGKADTWGCGGNANQLHERFLAEEAGPVLGRHLVEIAWRSGAKTFLHEQRELTAYNTSGGTLLEFASLLTSAGGKVVLDGNAPHAGFQFRAAREVSEGTQSQTYFLRPDGKGQLNQARASAMNLPWDAMSFVVEGKRYTVLYIDSPRNPKPAEYNERTYGRFGSFFKYELDDGKDLLANYRLWVQQGEMTVEQAAAIANQFAEPAEVVVAVK